MIQSYLLKKPTVTAYKLASRIANATTNTPRDDRENNSSIPSRLPKESKWTKNIIVHYTHEARFTNYKRLMHQLWNQIFNDTLVLNTRLIIGNRNNSSNKLRLAHRRSYQSNPKSNQITDKQPK